MIRKSLVECLKEKNQNLTTDEAERLVETADHKPCRIYCTNEALKRSMENASSNLESDQFDHNFRTSDLLDTQPQKDPSTSLGKAILAVYNLMIKLDHRWYRGHIYSKHPKGKSYS